MLILLQPLSWKDPPPPLSALSGSQNAGGTTCDTQLPEKQRQRASPTPLREHWEQRTGQDMGFCHFPLQISHYTSLPRVLERALRVKWNKYYLTNPYWGSYLVGTEFELKSLEV